MLKRIRDHLTQLLHLKESPRRTAAAFAVGVVIAFSPTYGLHTASVFFFAWAFRLNFIAVMAGNLINNPWTTIPILGLTLWTGFIIMGIPPVAFQVEDMSFQAFYEQIMPFIVPFFVGGIFLSTIGGLLGFFISYFVISRYRSRHGKSDLKAEPLPPPTGLR